MKIVLDTNCLIACLPQTSPYYCVWQAFRNKQISFCFTVDIINEYTEILARFYSPQFVSDVINELLFTPYVIKTDAYYRWNLISADPDDNKFVDCALNAGVDYLVTNDRHFNILKSIDFPPVKVIDLKTFKSKLQSL